LDLDVKQDPSSHVVSLLQVVLPANSAVPEDEMQLLCDAVATMAGFWTSAKSSNEGATELVFQVC
jgi:hypothetical protein